MERHAGLALLEKKFFDEELAETFTSAGTIATNSAGQATLTAIPTGDGASARSGRRALITSFHVKGYIKLSGLYPANTAVDPDGELSDSIRMIFYVDKQCNGAAATAANLLATANDHNSFRNLEYNKRFYILLDKTMTISSGNLTHNGTYILSGDVYKNFSFNKTFKKGLPIVFTGTGTPAMTNIISNNINVLLISEENNQTIVRAQCRARFTD